MSIKNLPVTIHKLSIGSQKFFIYFPLSYVSQIVCTELSVVKRVRVR